MILNILRGFKANKTGMTTIYTNKQFKYGKKDHLQGCIKMKFEYFFKNYF